jgi:hypothetical protein
MDGISQHLRALCTINLLFITLFYSGNEVLLAYLINAVFQIVGQILVGILVLSARTLTRVTVLKTEDKIDLLAHPIPLVGLM